MQPTLNVPLLGVELLEEFELTCDGSYDIDLLFDAFSAFDHDDVQNQLKVEGTYLHPTTYLHACRGEPYYSST